MSDETPRLKLAQLVSLQELNAITWNEALAQLDALVDLCLLGQFVNTPPATSSDGDAYLLGGAPAGAWNGYAYKIASYLDGGWRFYTPFNGLRAYVPATGAFIVYLNGAWMDWNALISSNEVSIASAASCDLGSANALFVQITGSTAITSFGTGANKLRYVRFSGALSLTHNATTLILLGGASRITAAGDVGLYASDGAGNWRERSYLRASTDPGDAATKKGSETLSNKTLTATAFPGGAITASGLFGLGTVAPQSTLHIVDQGGAVTRGFCNDQYSTSAAAALSYFRKARGTQASPIAVANGDYCGAFIFALHDGAAFRATANFGARVNGPVANNAIPTELYFATSGGADDTDSYNNGHVRLLIKAAGDVVPGSDNTQNFGNASARWNTIFAGTGTINTSGAASKQDRRGLSAAEIAVAITLAADTRVFRFCDAVAAKGEGARLHIGMLYEEVVAAFAAQGLDPLRYGIVCCDRSDGAPKEIFGLRYDELAQFVMAGLAARLAALEARHHSATL